MSAPDLRRLLGLAAKAAGWNGCVNFSADETWAVFSFAHGGGPGFERSWCAPHLDDGDSRRLQVACRITAGCDEYRAWAERWDDCAVRHNITELHDGDPAGKMRELVLRTAAEMGEAMP